LERAGISASEACYAVQCVRSSQAATARRVREMSIRDSRSADAAIDGIGGREANAAGAAGSTEGAGVVMRRRFPVTGRGKPVGGGETSD
jgi:hypothetical protein